jgi:hypothetical protein
MIGRIATQIARIAPREQALKIVKREPQLIERSTGKGLGKEFVDGIANGRRATDLNSIRDIKIVATILGNHVRSGVHGHQVYISGEAVLLQKYLLLSFCIGTVTVSEN